MAVITIRNLPDEVRARLRIRASRNGRSTEAEARAIIASAVNAPSPEEMPEAIARIQNWFVQSKKKRAKTEGEGKVDVFLRDRRRNAIKEAIDDGFHPRQLFRGEFSRIASEADWAPDYIDQLVKKNAP